MFDFEQLDVYKLSLAFAKEVAKTLQFSICFSWRRGGGSKELVNWRPFGFTATLSLNMRSHHW